MRNPGDSRALLGRAGLNRMERRSAEAIADAVRRALARAGAHDVPVAVDVVESIPRTALGKAPLVRRASLAALRH